MITRFTKTKNIKVVSYIDGLGASCASWLPMVADEVCVYNTSMLMVHKPMSSLFGANANDMQSEIELLNKLENDIMIPIYMSKATDNLTEDKLKDMMSKETWLNVKEIQELFNVTLIEEDREIVACADIELLKKYKNMPKNLKEGSFFNAQKPAKSKIAEEAKAMEGFENFGKNIYKPYKIFK